MKIVTVGLIFNITYVMMMGPNKSNKHQNCREKFFQDLEKDMFATHF